MSSVNGKVFHTGYSLLTPANIASYLKRSFTNAETSIVEGMITSIEAEFALRCNRNFDSTLTYYEIFNGGFTTVMLKNTPISSLKKLYIDGVDKTSLYILDTNYFLYENTLVFVTPITGAKYPYNAIKIEYEMQKFWGEDVINLLKKWIGYEFLNSENAGIGVRSMSFDTLSQDFDITAFNKEKEDMIFRYTNFDI